MKIGIVGLWHLGEVFSACLADVGNHVIGIDEDQGIVDRLNSGIAPLAEPRLEEMLKKNIAKGRLTFTTNFASLSDCDAMWITIDTPVDTNDTGNVKSIFTALKKGLSYLKNGTLIIVSSQVPVGTGSTIIRSIKKHRKGLVFDYVYIPENLRLGQAVESFMNPSRIVIGINSNRRKDEVLQIFKKLKTTILTVTVASAEMIKHATNAYLATSLSFTYDIADICERVGADIVQVASGLRADKRIGTQAYLDASAGFSGGHLARDLQYLQKVALAQKITLPVIAAVIQKNTKRPEIILRKIEPHLKTVRGKTITFFGITYKSGTQTLIRSLPLMVATKLHQNGAIINLYDPWIDEGEIANEMSKGTYRYYTDPYMSVTGSHVIICITPWMALKKLDYQKIARCMKRPKLFFDARNYFADSQSTIEQAGITYMGVGR